ncbi:hypothetical protein BGW38_000711 [Lunasporangiospora selenospora]|uniref:VPS4-associated protein 1 n=1 Tax=Lunasporangiospora selenospora TaxID=979761 RepID=A0A9P6FVA8_9FUNG|nr:hypothetical protein BGW38_000711 [Lunasporangiospora selenospora]
MSAAPLRNVYVEKTAATERSCFICMRITTKVLTAKDGGDWFFICPSHLLDPGFAKGEGYPTAPTPEALAAVAAARKKRADAEGQKKATPEKTDTATSSTDQDGKKPSAASQLGSAVFSGLGSMATKTMASVSAFINDEEETKARIAAQEQERRQAELLRRPSYWVLHRDIFFLRQNEVKKKSGRRALEGVSFPKVPGGF